MKKGGKCRNCQRENIRKLYGYKPDKKQEPGKLYQFPCGCEGILPEQKGESNLFARFDSNCQVWKCRILMILNGSRALGRKYGYCPIPMNTPHSVIRKMMERQNCELCRQPLIWNVGFNKTPHLHHNHSTGEIYGFAHFRCNTRALEEEVRLLRECITTILGSAEKVAYFNAAVAIVGSDSSKINKVLGEIKNL